MTDQPLNPDDALTELRGLVVDALANAAPWPLPDSATYDDEDAYAEHAGKVERLARLAGALDSHMAHGGPMPREWTTRHHLTELPKPPEGERWRAAVERRPGGRVLAIRDETGDLIGASAVGISLPHAESAINTAWRKGWNHAVRAAIRSGATLPPF